MRDIVVEEHQEEPAGAVLAHTGGKVVGIPNQREKGGALGRGGANRVGFARDVVVGIEEEEVVALCCCVVMAGW